MPADLHNEHVYKHYRWKGWVALQMKRCMRSEFMYQWAEDERAHQIMTRGCK